MKLKYGDFSIPCKTGDEIKFELYPSGTQHQVHYLFGEDQNQLAENETFGLRCDMNTYKSKPLSMILVFSEPEGGKYEIRAKRQNGSIEKFTIKQPGGSTIKIIQFGLEGDPYTDYD